MRAEPNSDDLFEMLRLAQHLGFLGSAPIERVVAQGDLFVAGLTSVDSGGRVVDLGSGGGSPGLVVAVRRPDLMVTLIDRRRKRTDFLMRAVRRLELANVEVVCGDVVKLRLQVVSGDQPIFDGLTARGFGPFSLLTASVADLLRPGGVAVISEPDGSDRWAPETLDTPALRFLERLPAGSKGEVDRGGSVGVVLRVPTP